MSTVRLATRTSPLALAQAHFVAERLAERGVSSTLVEVTTTGDRDLTTPLSSVGGQGVFAVEIQRALLRGEADAAVHSAKDLPSTSPEGLVIAAVPERRDPRDVIVGRALAGLGPGATVATGSPRRRALLLERRPDLNVVELRGNMATRVAAADAPGIDAVIAAAAALDRLGWLDRVAEYLDPTWFVPQVGQGALALECRVDDDHTRTLLSALSDDDAEHALRIERAFLRELGAGCSVPAAAHAVRDAGQWRLDAIMAAADGSSVVRGRDNEGDGGPEELGSRLAARLRDDEGGATLDGWR